MANKTIAQLTAGAAATTDVVEMDNGASFKLTLAQVLGLVPSIQSVVNAVLAGNAPSLSLNDGAGAFTITGDGANDWNITSQNLTFNMENFQWYDGSSITSMRSDGSGNWLFSNDTGTLTIRGTFQDHTGSPGFTGSGTFTNLSISDGIIIGAT